MPNSKRGEFAPFIDFTDINLDLSVFDFNMSGMGERHHDQHQQFEHEQQHNHHQQRQHDQPVRGKEFHNQDMSSHGGKSATVPPTPTSLDLVFGNSGVNTSVFPSPSSMNEAMGREDLMFTPLLSPAISYHTSSTYFKAQSYPLNSSSAGSPNNADYARLRQPGGVLSSPQIGLSPKATTAFIQPSEDVSSSDSISPEPLMSSDMAPPPVPSTTSGNGIRTQRRLAPVTPSSLMNLSQNSSPEDADQKQQLQMQMHKDGGDGKQIGTSLQRPIRPTVSTDMSGRPVRPVKPMRSRTGSPKISPNLMPLLPSGVEAASQLLASKSNYQNILEGKHSQLGLSYPEQLTEQGRRNRINNALSELNQLLVENFNAPDNAMPPVPQQCSKANTVELAIEYIKKLQGRIDTLKRRLKDTRNDLAIERSKDGSASDGKSSETMNLELKADA
ncbi:hypothetical protein V1511DRAFT_520337 [Dipodascopsis uninucleata]